MTAQDFTLSCPVFEADDRIGRDYTCDGNDVPPPLVWRNVPDGTKSMALIVDDPDAPSGTFTHWLLWDLSPTVAADEPVNLAGLGVPGRNDFQTVGYGGPCPPPDHGEHRYQFKLHALDVSSLGLGRGATRKDLEEAMKDHVIDTTELVGRYAR